MKCKVVMLRSGSVNPDPPVEKAAAELIKAGYEVTVLAWDRDGKYSVAESELALPNGNAEIVRFGIPAVYSGGFKKNIIPLMRFEKRLLGWLGKNQYDIIHAFDLDTGFIAAVTAKKYRKKLIYHILDFYADCRCRPDTALANFIKNIEFSVINSAEAVIVCTEKRLCQIEGSKPKRTAVIHNTPDGKILEGVAAHNCLNSERMRIAYVGVLLHDRLLRELLECVMCDERYEMYIAGFGELEDYIKECAGTCGRITYYGRLPYNKALALENSCDIMTAMYAPHITNHRYTAPNKLYEAMMLGKPVIMCKNTGWDEVITENNIGVLTDGSYEGVREALNLLYNQKEQWRTMGENGKTLYNNMYSWEIMGKRLIDLYDAVIGEEMNSGL